LEHLTQKQVEDYSQHRLSAAELLLVTDHLGECEACQRRIAGGDAAFLATHAGTLGEDLSAHLTPEQTADYVDKNLSGESLQVITDHLSSCEQCVFAVEDLRSFRNEIAPSLDRKYRPASVPASTARSWRERFVSFFRVSPIPAFASAALAVLLLGMMMWLVWRTPREAQREVAVAPSPSLQPSPLPTPSLQPEPAASPVTIVAQLNDGPGVLSLDAEGKLSGAEDLPPAYQNVVKKALTTQRIERSAQLQGLSRPASSLMGADQKQEFYLIEPVGSVLMTNQPTLRWSRMVGATAYVVEVYDDQFKLAASSPQLTDLSWPTSPALARGKVYSWQVKAIKDGQEITSPRPPAPQAKFRILDQGKANELARAKRVYGSSHLTLGLLYAEAGLLKEAEQELRLLRRANPNSELARTLLRQIQALQHR
jgi:hypothetical protein